MIYLLLSVLSSTAIFVIFKLFKKFKIDTLQAIVVNYFAAFGCGLFLYKGEIVPSEIIKTNWFIGAFILGFLFIAIFNVMALTSQKNGLSVASVASKMSVVTPVLFGFLALKETINAPKIIGIGLALLAVYLTSIKPKDDIKITKSLYLPVLLFFGSGIIDTSINYFAPDDKIPLFSAVIFIVAAIIGVLLLIYKAIVSKSYFRINAIPLGIALGIVNYCSIHFLLMALLIDSLESSTLFTVNNVAIVAFTTITGLILFKEKLSKKNWLGIIIAMISIVLVTVKYGS